jgi:hypothetical protein
LAALWIRAFAMTLSYLVADNSKWLPEGANRTVAELAVGVWNGKADN